ncbi:MAG: glycosyltransferase family 4 protein [Candidatus Bathyarchaeia archaeon]|jgi:glycosyltransferase involved in cell wall biosynthesis
MGQNRLCIVTHTFLPHVGGIEKVVYEQSKRLKQKNFVPQVVTSRIQTAPCYKVEGINVACYNSMNLGFRLGIPYVFPSVASLGVFTKAVKGSRIVHAHGHPYLSSLLAGKLAKQYGKPFVLTQHNTFIDYNNIFEQVERLNDLTVGKQSLREADKVIAISNATKNYVLSLGVKPSKVQVIHNGVDLQRFKPLKNVKAEMRRKLGIPQDAKVVLTVRRLVYKNGIDTLIQCACLAIKKNPKIVFLAVGKGPDISSVQQQIKQLGLEGNFKLAGFVPDQELHLYYNTADLFVLPSKSGEGLPLVAQEAMACGLPVVATNVGGISEILVKKFGKLVPANNPEAMANAVIEFAEINFEESSGELRAIVEEKYGWDKNVDRLIEIYEELI